MKYLDYNLSKPCTIHHVFAAILNKTLSLTPNKRGFGFCRSRKFNDYRLFSFFFVVVQLLCYFCPASSDFELQIEETNDKKKVD